MARRRKSLLDHGGGGGGGHGGGGAGRWLVSYADFITLMFVVFTVLFSMARVDLSKFDQVAKSFRSAMGPSGPDLAPFQAQAQSGRPLGVMPPERPGVAIDYPPELIDPDDTKSLSRFNPNATTPPETVQTEPTPEPAKPTTTTPVAEPEPLGVVAEVIKSTGSGLARVNLASLGLELTYHGSVFFDPQRTDLKPEAKTELDFVMAKLKEGGVAQHIIVKCVADEKTADGSTPTTLASNRAAQVTDYLRSRPGMDQVNFTSSADLPPGEPGEKPTYQVTILVVRPAQ